MKPYKHSDSRSNRMWSGVVVLLTGVIFLLSNFGIHLPHWLFSWSTFLLVIGLVVGAKRNFNGGGWLIMVLIGGYFTLSDMMEISLSKYYFPFAFIALGLYLILKPRKNFVFKMQQKEAADKKKADFGIGDENAPEGQTVDENDYVDSVNVFGGSKQNIFSKNFKGGDVISIFGGCELNLTNADFEDTITIDVVAVFGGIKIVVPPNWDVKSEVTAIFGGIEDKRTVLPSSGQPNKIIRIKGLALFGGMSVTNF